MGDVNISPLGQPAGSYVVLPCQTLSREHFPAIDANEEHILIMTNCRYDVDRVIEETIKALNEGVPVSDDEATLPVYIRKL